MARIGSGLKETGGWPEISSDDEERGHGQKRMITGRGFF